MNSVMLASILTGKLSVGNLAAITAEDAMTLLVAMNGGMKEWFDGLPPKNKQTKVSETLRAPLSMVLSVVDGGKGFTYVSPPFPTGGYADETALLGKTVTLSAAGPLNRLDKSNTLLKPYFGATGEVPATFWSDAVGFPSTSVRVVDAPIWEGEQSGRWELLPVEGDFFPVLESYGSIGRSPESGPPRFYQSGPLNPTLGSVRMWFLRVWPLPNQRGTLTFTLETIPPVLSFDALQVPVDITIPDEDMPEVIRLCEDRLVSTPLWHPKADKSKTVQDAAAARGRLEKLWIPLDARPASIATPCNY